MHCGPKTLWAQVLYTVPRVPLPRSLSSNHGEYPCPDPFSNHYPQAESTPAQILSATTTHKQDDPPIWTPTKARASGNDWLCRFRAVWWQWLATYLQCRAVCIIVGLLGCQTATFTFHPPALISFNLCWRPWETASRPSLKIERTKVSLLPNCLTNVCVPRQFDLNNVNTKSFLVHIILLSSRIFDWGGGEALWSDYRRRLLLSAYCL